MHTRTALFYAAAVLVSGLPPEGLAQKYPTKPMRLISAFAPGGATGSELMARATPDGYTIIMVASTYTATSAYNKPSFDPVNGIQPIVLIGTTGLVMTVHLSVPARSVRELIISREG